MHDDTPETLDIEQRRARRERSRGKRRLTVIQGNSPGQSQKPFGAWETGDEQLSDWLPVLRTILRVVTPSDLRLSEVLALIATLAPVVARVKATPRNLGGVP
jgi:hypothetical protein